ncbi:hypothetical protein INR49_006709 [Caranx melampygus]|nr:hypothetical protein INR49_006709 [Caranx melampygus]
MVVISRHYGWRRCCTVYSYRTGIISTFLHVHPFGANLEYLWSYIQRLDSKVSAGELERLMVRLPTMFRQELSGVGATLEKRWKFCGFESLGSA